MNRRGQNVVTFEGLLEQTAPANAERLMQRARAANCLAKTVNGKARAAAYRIKTDALVTLANRFPDRVELRRDFRLPQMIVVAVDATRFGLHVPAQNFAAGEGLR